MPEKNIKNKWNVNVYEKDVSTVMVNNFTSIKKNQQ